MYDYTYYDYDYGYEATTAATGLAAFGVGLLVFWLIAMAISVINIIAMWKVFKKAGKPGWAAIIPIYNIIVMIEISELPMWYIALYFVPGANIYAMIKINIEIAHRFGKSTGFGVGMALLQPVFLAILAFNKSVTYGGVASVSQPVYQQPVQPTPQVQPQPMVQPVTPVMPVPEVQPVAPVEPTPVMPTPEVQPVATVEPTPVMPTPEITPVQPAAPIVEPVVQPASTVQQPEINQAPTPAFCTNCGNPLMPNSKFCTKCGKQL